MALALIDKEGKVASRLTLINPPADFVVPEGMLLSWQFEYSFIQSSLVFSCPPLLAHLTYKSAVAEITTKAFMGFLDAECTVSVTVQGKVPSDVVVLRDRVLELVHQKSWPARFDFTPKLGFIETFFLSLFPKKA